MGADWYTFVSTTAAAIPVPKEALQLPFDLQGFKLMTVQHNYYDEKRQGFGEEYLGAMICLENTELLLTSLEVMGPYEIKIHEAQCKRMKHLDAFMPADARDRLVSAFETYTGRKPHVVPGFWAMSVTCDYFVRLHTTWSLPPLDRIVGEHCVRFGFVQSDADGSDA
ncbi:hypothetical protein BGZ97_000988 [Linnemannia gamsii]|jgi:hypothetical protein|uniref:Uncharacterized protein n=1 Tax=Linnemannia gamsii TaxID=64522 RepID=A0A9P6UJR6_9FUNG|nr:hypothetical protein BGZ97_000988 [Linnemannia gamsii]